MWPWPKSAIWDTDYPVMATEICQLRQRLSCHRGRNLPVGKQTILSSWPKYASWDTDYPQCNRNLSAGTLTILSSRPKSVSWDDYPVIVAEICQQGHRLSCHYDRNLSSGTLTNLSSWPKFAGWDTGSPNRNVSWDAIPLNNRRQNPSSSSLPSEHLSQFSHLKQQYSKTCSFL